MEENILYLVNTKVKYDIIFEKIGIKLRNINQDEIKYIKYRIERLYCSKSQKNLLERYRKVEIIDKNNADIETLKEAIDIYKKINELDNEKKSAIFYLDKVNGIIDKRSIKNILKNCLIIEVDRKRFEKCFGNLNPEYVVFRMIMFANYLTGECEMKKFYYTKLKNFNKYEDVINNSFYNEKINVNNLKRLSGLLNKRDINFNTNFIYIIENFLLNNMSLENKIVNMVSIIEKLLIKKYENKQESFILKVGILLNGCFGWNNEKISKILKTIYELRSLIVHGEEDKIYENKDKYADIFDYEKLKKIEDKISIRNNIFILIANCLELITKLVINKYLDNIEFCEYLKLN